MSFTDSEFPPNENSLGPDVAGRVNVQWRRPNDFSGRSTANLFAGGIEPGDARQGGLGDCWLISSLSTVAEYPAVIKHLFKDCAISDEGRYTCRIYDPEVKKYVEITIDDQIPCKPRGGPAFAQSPNGEFWVCILEKAFAKWVGSYSKLSGGWPALALTAITGARSQLYQFRKTQVMGLSFGDLTVKKAANLTGGASISSVGENYSIDEFFNKLKEYDEADNLMTLASPGKDVYSEGEGPNEDFGIVGGHAYSLIAVKEVDGMQLCNIRNPWGDFEWGGDWSDRSDKWDQYPNVKNTLNPSLNKDDGDFWMAYSDMVTIFTGVTINFMSRETASQPEPAYDENGNPKWIGQLGSLFAEGGSTEVAIEKKFEELTGIKVDFHLAAFTDEKNKTKSCPEKTMLCMGDLGKKCVIM